jgi:hypothetical protein
MALVSKTGVFGNTVSAAIFVGRVLTKRCGKACSFGGRLRLFFDVNLLAFQIGESHNGRRD